MGMPHNSRNVKNIFSTRVPDGTLMVLYFSLALSVSHVKDLHIYTLSSLTAEKQHVRRAILSCSLGDVKGEEADDEEGSDDDDE